MGVEGGDGGDDDGRGLISCLSDYFSADILPAHSNPVSQYSRALSQTRVVPMPGALWSHLSVTSFPLN